MILRLENVIQPYAWGSRTALAELRGAPSPAPGPEAELWMGAHPSAPSALDLRGARMTLAELIRRDPEGSLGPECVARFGLELPFLLKVLAAAMPLSLQAHPTQEQARAGFARENDAGLELGAATRSYKDPNHKPELIAALTPFHALSGFRPIERTRRLFAELSLGALDAPLSLLAQEDPELALRSTFGALMTLPRDAQATAVGELRDGIARALGRGSEFSAELRWAERLGELHPNDIGVVSALLLNLVTLKPGEAIYLPAGNLHAYLEGTGVEIMASSDNVLRGGLTPKHVDVPELLGILDFSELAIQPLVPEPLNAVERVYRTSASEFQLSVLRVAGAARISDRTGPELLLVTGGSVEVKSDDGGPLHLSRGASAFVPASEGEFTLRGVATVHRARVPSDPSG